MWVHNPLAGAIALAVMLFDIAHAGPCADEKAVQTVVLGFFCAGVVNTAAGHDDYVGIFPDVKIVVNSFRQAALAEHHRDVDALIFGAGLDVNINAGLVLLGFNLDVGGAAAAGAFAV